MRVCFATNNSHKLSEAKAVLGEKIHILNLSEVGCHETLDEEGDTLEANSMQKARYVFEKYKIACFADDTGLEVDTLQGEPGVYSARYAGIHSSDRDNMELLLYRLKGIRHREATFRTIITLLMPQYCRQFEGKVRGHILEAPRGKKGFGYDPIFVPRATHLSMAEMTAIKKNAISHRRKALDKLFDFLATQKNT